MAANPSSTPKKVGCLGAGFFVLVIGLIPATCVGPWYYAKTAPPVAKTVELIESDPRVAEALGAPVSVSLFVTTEIERELFDAMRGRDHVSLITTAGGARDKGYLHVTAQNVGGQGWAGTFSLDVQGRQVLRNGAYESEGGGTVIAGTFAPDGKPLVKPR